MGFWKAVRQSVGLVSPHLEFIFHAARLKEPDKMSGPGKQHHLLCKVTVFGGCYRAKCAQPRYRHYTHFQGAGCHLQSRLPGSAQDGKDKENVPVAGQGSAALISDSAE